MSDRPTHERRASPCSRRLASYALLVVSACAYASDTGPVANRTLQHAVESARLREVMQEIDGLRVDRLPQEMDTGALIGRRLDQFGEIGDALAAAATHIPEALDRVTLDAASRARFNDLVETLRRQSLALRSRATEGNLDAAIATYEQLHTTCDACHALYRKTPG